MYSGPMQDHPLEVAFAQMRERRLGTPHDIMSLVLGKLAAECEALDASGDWDGYGDVCDLLDRAADALDKVRYIGEAEQIARGREAQREIDADERRATP